MPLGWVMGGGPAVSIQLLKDFSFKAWALQLEAHFLKKYLFTYLTVSGLSCSTRVFYRGTQTL